MERLLATGSILGTKSTCSRHVLIDKKLDEMGDRLFFKKIIGQQSCVSVSSVMRFNKTAAIEFA
jgi:hypothetical protein